MTTDHSHNHRHSHQHSHDHGHSHGHTHSHENELTLEQKLEKLVAHWIDHNDSHKETYFTWARRAKEDGMESVAEKINRAGQLSDQVTSLLKEALSQLKK